MKKGELTREHILKCSEKIFSEKGYYEAQVSDIVAIAHIAKGTIYQYFKNKEDIFLTLLEIYASQWEEEISLDMKDFMGDRPAIEYARAYLKHRLNKTVAFFGKNQDRTNIILRMGPGLNNSIEAIINLFEEKILKVIIHDIGIGQKQGHIPKELNVDIAGNAILGAVLRISFYYFILKRASYQELDLHGFLDELEKLVINSLNMK